MASISSIDGNRFEFPTDWKHGRGISAEAGDLVKQTGGKNVLVLTDRRLLSLGLLKPVLDSLDAASVSYRINDSIGQEPSVALFEDLVGRLDLQSYDTIIAFGGGSVLDTAKGVAVVATFGGHIRDYDGFNKIPTRPRQKIIAIPTTSGTGSEVSDGVVLIDEQRDTKFLVISKKICPDIALTDPELTLSMPPAITAQSGVDALTHAIESYISRKSTQITEQFSINAIKQLGSALPVVYRDGKNIDFREQAQVGATSAMIAAMNSYLGLCHAMAMPLCALYDMPHGVACGMTLPVVLEYNMIVVAEKIQAVYEYLGFWEETFSKEKAFKLANIRLRDMIDAFGICRDLKQFGFESCHMKSIVEGTMNSAQKATSPRQPTESDIEKIVEQLLAPTGKS